MKKIAMLVALVAVWASLSHQDAPKTLEASPGPERYLSYVVDSGPTNEPSDHPKDRPTEKDGELVWSKYLATQMHGLPEHVLPDGTRVDIMTPGIAWEVDWFSKWHEAVGQSLYYGIATGTRPGIILLRKPGDSDEDWLRCMIVCRRYGIILHVEKTYKS